MDRQPAFEYLLVLALMSVCVSAWSLTDPTRPYGYVEVPEFVEVVIPEESTEWILSGIRIYGDDRQAILNGVPVREGEMIENAKVLTINETSVVVEEGDRHLVVKLLDTRVKKPARKDSEN
ncbi:MAG: general secretion pathway protein GspB [Thiotrichales bacterium]|nr:general secretion pathway protein GspB [Thiotrichales bacterium]